ncbi:MAG: phosphomannomutase/phosphoglucomutase [Sphaerochaeta sp.]
MKHKFNKEILKACDIRGIYIEELNEEDFYYIGKAFATILVQKNMSRCSVGRDGRVSSKSLEKALIQGLSECNIEVIDLGFVSTPALYFSQSLLNTDGCCMISASHNPGIYNGCKFVLKNEVFAFEYIKLIEDIATNGNFLESSKIGTISNYDIKQDYVEHLLSVINLECLKNANIVWDASNGASLFMLETLIRRLPGNHTIICEKVDGNFPYHEPDPSKEKNMQMLKDAVIENSADLGIAFDGDGDRLGCVTSCGCYVTGDQLLLILAKDYLSDNPGAEVMSEVKASKVFYQQISEAGGIPVMWKVGHTFQKMKAISDDIGFAGETSGHIFYKENNWEDDGTYAALKLLNLLYNRTKTTLDYQVCKIPYVFTKGEVRLNMGSDDREGLVENLKKRLDIDQREYNSIDGVRVECPDGFWLIRGSNTQPQITTYVEAFSDKTYDDTLSDMKEYLSSCGFDYDTLLQDSSK